MFLGDQISDTLLGSASPRKFGVFFELLTNLGDHRQHHAGGPSEMSTDAEQSEQAWLKAKQQAKEIKASRETSAGASGAVNEGLGVVRIKPLGAGGGGVEASSNGGSAIRWGKGRGVHVNATHFSCK